MEKNLILPSTPNSSSSSTLGMPSLIPNSSFPQNPQFLKLAPNSSGISASSSPTIKQTPYPVLRPQSSISKKKLLFEKEIKQMMYGFGDSKNCLRESVELMEDLALDYIKNMTIEATKVGANKRKLKLEDFLFLIRKDKKKYSRAKELIIIDEQLKEARRVFDESTFQKD